MTGINEMLDKLSQLEKRKLILQNQIKDFDRIIKEYQEVKEDIELVQTLIMYSENKKHR